MAARLQSERKRSFPMALARIPGKLLIDQAWARAPPLGGGCRQWTEYVYHGIE